MRHRLLSLQLEDDKTCSQAAMEDGEDGGGCRRAGRHPSPARAPAPLPLTGVSLKRGRYSLLGALMRKTSCIQYTSSIPEGRAAQVRKTKP